MIEFEKLPIYYKMYLGTYENNYVTKYQKKTIEELYMILENIKDDFDKYLIIEHSNILNQDTLIERQDIEHTTIKTRKRER